MHVHGQQLEVQGIQEGKMSTTTRVKVKVTIIWNTVYEFEFWVMDHSAGSEVVLGTDFMIPAGIRLNLFDATTKLPGEEILPLVKSLIKIQLKEFSVAEKKRKHLLGAHEVWVRHTAVLDLQEQRNTADRPRDTTHCCAVPTIIRFQKGHQLKCDWRISRTGWCTVQHILT
ncbi:Eukaryotic/viral aspartic protease [Phytophthora megakarya]|uniref:Eukaryotic/viral aspartic protease n=1 Tax=Phytophthora megakarya TaxID=4795 RepID=A0A225VND6_9STRA|nr:Eukaryotic/viral aspartic protease [Phytophthora megakarya]